MRFVLDASVAITWAMSDEDHAAADLAFEHIQTGSALVPAIWWYEIRNVLLLNERRKRISPEDARQFLSDLNDFDIEIRLPEDSHRTLDLARKHNLSVYDAAYLALAIAEDLPISTLDEKLQSAAQSLHVPLLG